VPNGTFADKTPVADERTPRSRPTSSQCRGCSEEFNQIAIYYSPGGNPPLNDVLDSVADFRIAPTFGVLGKDTQAAGTL
jgi:hypothetical protein